MTEEKIQPKDALRIIRYWLGRLIPVNEQKTVFEYHIDDMVQDVYEMYHLACSNTEINKHKNYIIRICYTYVGKKFSEHKKRIESLKHIGDSARKKLLGLRQKIQLEPIIRLSNNKECQQLLLAHYSKGYPYEVIAFRMKKSASAIRKKASRCIEKIRSVLRKNKNSTNNLK